MSFEKLVGFICQSFAGPGAEEMEPGHAQLPVLPVEQVNPLVKLDQLVLPVPMVGGRGAIVREPDHFGGVKEGGDTKLISQAWVVTVLVLEVSRELLNILLNRVIVTSFE